MFVCVAGCCHFWYGRFLVVDHFMHLGRIYAGVDANAIWPISSCRFARLMRGDSIPFSVTFFAVDQPTSVPSSFFLYFIFVGHSWFRRRNKIRHLFYTFEREFTTKLMWTNFTKGWQRITLSVFFLAPWLLLLCLFWTWTCGDMNLEAYEPLVCVGLAHSWPVTSSVN